MQDNDKIQWLTFLATPSGLAGLQFMKDLSPLPRINGQPQEMAFDAGRSYQHKEIIQRFLEELGAN